MNGSKELLFGLAIPIVMGMTTKPEVVTTVKYETVFIEVNTAMYSVPTKLPLKTHRISSKFGMRYHPILHVLRPHSGIDIAAPKHTPIIIGGSGRVTRAEYAGAYGWLIDVCHGHDELGAEITTRYAHLASKPCFNEGDLITEGTIIGFVGNTGRSTGPHLHLEYRVNGKPVNPLKFLK